MLGFWDGLSLDVASAARLTGGISVCLYVHHGIQKVSKAGGTRARLHMRTYISMGRGKSMHTW